MISTNTIRPRHPDAPHVVDELRALFDARLTELHAVARDLSSTRTHGASHMVHVDFPAGPLQATAMYNAELDLFTQLIARAADEAHFERPSFTISLFLEQVAPRT